MLNFMGELAWANALNKTVACNSTRVQVDLKLTVSICVVYETPI